jgi:predicted DNA-binding transcriptional regulator AlpA
MSQQQDASETELGLTKAAASLILAAEALEKVSTVRSGAMKPATPRRGLSRGEAADYIGVSQTLFDTMVKVGQMPKPIKAMSRSIWDIRALDEAFTDLATEQITDPWN